MAQSSVNSREQTLKFAWHPPAKPQISPSRHVTASLLSFLSKVNSIKAVRTGVQRGLSGDFPLIISKTFQPRERECSSVSSSSRYWGLEDCIALAPRLDSRAALSVCECVIQQAQLVCFPKWKVCIHIEVCVPQADALTVHDSTALHKLPSCLSPGIMIYRRRCPRVLYLPDSPFTKIFFLGILLLQMFRQDL